MVDIIQKKVRVDEKNPINVVITGAAGQIAYSLYAFLGTGEIFGKDQPINLKLLDIEPAQNALKGVELELQDCAYPLINSIEYGFQPLTIFRDADVGIFLGGFPRKPGQERKDLLQINNKIFVEQGQALDQVAKKTVKCLVIANPANTNCLSLAKNAPSIPKKNFTCLTRLDHNRAIAQLAIKAQQPVNKVKNVTIWGNHSSTQYPDFHHATVNGEPLSNYINDTAYLQGDFISRVQKRGAEVLEARKNSSVVSAANATKDHLKTWIFGTKDDEWVSMGIYVEKNNPYNIPEDIIFSFPVKCKDFDYQIVEGLEINQFSQQKIQITTKELLEERAESQAQ